MTIEDFYTHFAFGKMRKASAELDFGVWWRDDRFYPNFRITWVEDTGEVIAVNPQEEVIILGRTKPKDRGMIEDVLFGWADECGKPCSLDWIKNCLKTRGGELYE